MSIIFIIICVVVIICLFNYRSKIDQEEKVALKTPGRADKLRSNFSSLIDLLTRNPAHSILIERKYDESIRFGNNEGQELFIGYSSLGSHGPQIHVACIDHSVLLKEWSFDHRQTEEEIFNEISYYFK